MELIFKEKNTSVLFRIPNWENMQFGAVIDFYIAEKLDEILIACNVNQWDPYNSIADYL